MARTALLGSWALDRQVARALPAGPRMPSSVQSLYQFPRGTTLMAAIGLVHGDDQNFPDAAEFRPERFLGDAPPAPGSWIPFGGGARRCLGAGFSLLEATEILRAALARYDVRAARPKPETAQPRNVTLVPSCGCEILATRR